MGSEFGLLMALADSLCKVVTAVALVVIAARVGR